MRLRRRLLPSALISGALLAAAALAGCGAGGPEPPAGSGPRAGPSAEADLIGRWRGRLRQRDLEPFTATADIRSLREPRRNVVLYTGIDCGGYWTYLGREEQTFRFRETIDRGKGGDCKGVGTVTLERESADRLRYEFRGGGVESRGTLVRQDA
jgi:hypothetical protein